MSAMLDLYHRIPAPVRRLAAPVKAVRAFVASRRCPVWVLRGAERSCGQTLCVAFAGPELAKNYFARKVFSGTIQEIPLGHRWLRRAWDAARSAAPETELYLAELLPEQEKLFKKKVFARLPAWIRMDISLVDHAGERPSTKFKKARNMVGRNALTCEVTRDPELFDDFYLGYHLPHISAKHEDAAFALPAALAHQVFVESDRELLLVKKEGDTLGGAVLGYLDGEVHWWQMGVRPGLDGPLGRDIGDALYYHVFMRARQKGYESLHLGHCRPFLNDGVLEHKRNWGARIVAARMRSGGLLAMRLGRETEAVRSFLLNNPFVSLDREGRYHVCVFLEGDDSVAVQEVVDYYCERYCAPGSIDLRLYGVSPRVSLKSTRTV